MRGADCGFMAELVGDGHIRVVAQMRHAWDAAVSTAGPGHMPLLVVRGPSGSGRTRVLQEFYAQVMNSSDTPLRDEESSWAQPAQERHGQRPGEEEPTSAIAAKPHAAFVYGSRRSGPRG